MNKGLWGQPRGGGTDWVLPYSGASLTASVSQSIGAGQVNLAFDLEEWDTDNYHIKDGATNNSLLSVPAQGFYRLHLWLPWAASAVAGRRIAQIYVVRGVQAGAAVLCGRAEAHQTAVSAELNQYCVVEEYAQPSDVFLAQAIQTTGGTLATTALAADVRPRFQISRIG